MGTAGWLLEFSEVMPDRAGPIQHGVTCNLLVSRSAFDAAGDGFLKQGFADKAIAVWTAAAQHFPEDVEYWERIANEQVMRGHRQDAVLALLQGRAQLRKLKLYAGGNHPHEAQQPAPLP